MANTDDSWHLDKRVPVALILTIGLQTATAVWWAANVSARLSGVETSQAAITAEVVENEIRLRAEELASGRTEERFLSIQASLTRIERLLEEQRQ